MHYSKIIILLGIFLFIACKNNTSKESTPSEQAVVNGQLEIIEEPIKENTRTTDNASPLAPSTIEVVEMEATPTPPKKVSQPATTPKETSKPIQIIEKKEAPATKVVTKSKEPLSKPIRNKVQIIESKEKVIETAKEATATSPTTPVKVEQPQVAVPTTVQNKVEEKKPDKEVVELKKELTHTIWDGLLKKYVSATGKVNYKALKTDKKFDTYLQLLKDNPIQHNWSRNQKMAYWINAYNAFTIKLIVDNYPVSSITKLHGGKPWDHKWIQLGEKTYTLNDIEHKILRPQFKDARIHFAVNCAATSCPPVLNKAWTASNLNSNLERQTKLFINNGAFNSISDKKVELSKIFEWYKEDFGELIAYINKYANSKAKDGAEISFKEYDWALNE